MSPTLPVEDETRTTTTCPVCHHGWDTGPSRRCATCETPVHVDCFEFVGGCPRFACAEAASGRRRAIEFVRMRLRVLALDRFFSGVTLAAILTFLILEIGWLGWFAVSLGLPALGFMAHGVHCHRDARSLSAGQISGPRLLELLQTCLRGAPRDPHPSALIRKHFFIEGTVLLGIFVALYITYQAYYGPAFFLLAGAVLFKTWIGYRNAELLSASGRAAVYWRGELEGMSDRGLISTGGTLSIDGKQIEKKPEDDHDDPR